MTFNHWQITQNEPKTKEYIIDPLLLTQMELHVVKLLKFRSGQSNDMSISKNHSETNSTAQNLDAKQNPTPLGATSISKESSMTHLIDPQYFVNIYSPLYPQTVQVFMKFNQSHNSAPNDLGLHYLKETNKNPHASKINVDGQRRTIVHIKRESSKAASIGQNYHPIKNHGIKSNQPIQSIPIYEGWNQAPGNGNHLSQGQNFMSQANFQQQYRSLSSQPPISTEFIQENNLESGFSLISQSGEKSQLSKKYFSFGKNDKSPTKNSAIPYKIEQSNKEESSENNEEEKKQNNVISYKRANVGDHLPSKSCRGDDFNTLMSQKQQKDLEEKEAIEKKKIEKRKKQTRKLLLGQMDSDDQQGLANNQSIVKDQYAINNQKQWTNIGQQQVFTGTTAFNRNFLTIQNQQVNTSINSGNIQPSINPKIELNQSRLSANISFPRIQGPSQLFYNQINSTQYISFDPLTLNNRYQQPHEIVHPLASQKIDFQSSSPSQYPLLSNHPQSLPQSSNFPLITTSKIFEILYNKQIQRQQSTFNSCKEEISIKDKKTYPQRQNCSSQNFESLLEQFQELISPLTKNENGIPERQTRNSFDAVSQRIEQKIFNSKNIDLTLRLDQRKQSREKTWKLDCNLPLDIFIDLMYKYECKLNQTLIQQAQILIGSVENRNNIEKDSYFSAYPNLYISQKNDGLIGYIEQISSQNLSKLMNQMQALIYSRLTEVYLLISRAVDTAKIQYPKKQNLSTSSLSLYQYVQNCIINYSQILNDPLFDAYNFNRIISSSLQRLIWIKEIDHSRVSTNPNSFHQILFNPWPQNQSAQLQEETDPQKMTFKILKYLDQLDCISWELDSKLNLILQNLNQTNQDSSANQSSQDFQDFTFFENFPHNYLNEIRQALLLTKNVEKHLQCFADKKGQSLNDFSQKLKQQTKNKQLKSEMIDQNKQNQMTQFVATMIGILSGIESDLEMMNSVLDAKTNE